MHANLENRIADDIVVHLTATPTQRHAFSDIVRRGMALGTIFGDMMYHPVGRYLLYDGPSETPAHTLHLHARNEGCVTNDAQTILNMFTSLTFYSLLVTRFTNRFSIHKHSAHTVFTCFVLISESTVDI